MLAKEPSNAPIKNIAETGCPVRIYCSPPDKGIIPIVYRFQEKEIYFLAHSIICAEKLI
jgi:hypothetical protein